MKHGTEIDCEHFPRSEKLDGVTVANPILNEVCNPDFTFLAFAMSVSEIQSLPSSLATVIYAL
nr:hypothetical protein [uncultured Prevotella sp.]